MRRTVPITLVNRRAPADNPPTSKTNENFHTLDSYNWSMKPVHVFNVIPSLPASLEGLRRLSHNLRWAWDHGTIELFRRLDSDLWESTGHNPVLMLGLVDQIG